MSRLPQCGQARGTRSVKPQWWQRSVRSILWNTRNALQCGHSLFQLAGGAGQHRRIAAPVQEQQRLLAAGHALPDGGQQRRRDHRAPGLQVHVDQLHLRQAPLADARGHGQPRVAPALGGVPALQRGRGRAQHHLGALELAAHQRQVARRVARALLLLVAGVVLFVDHHQRQPRHRGEHRHARAQHDARGAGVRRQPALQPLRIRHAAVQRDHAGGAEALGEARLQLGREVDLRAPSPAPARPDRQASACATACR